MIVAFAVILGVIVLAIVDRLPQPTPSFVNPGYALAPRNVLDLLEERYARGELGREEFLKIREDLTRGLSQT